ncbi:MAG: conserved rane protein of unknown function [Symbiobacteriaceae bacterium]|jgi:hypothetical protein|nr:conserved rane protein of unknown function [Symbiobacteriaceae bacterium]
MDARRLDKNWIIGVLLIGFGALFLLGQFNVVHFLRDTIIGLMFLGGAAVFLSVFATDKQKWWALFPAAGLGFSGLRILMPNGGNIMGTIFFLLLGGAFLAVHATRRDQVWPLIPGGVMLTLAAVTFIETISFNLFDGGVIFFFGLAATFVAVWYRALDRHRYSWALIVAAVLGGIGCLVLIGSVMGMFLKFIVPVGMILIGVYALTEGRVFKR